MKLDKAFKITTTRPLNALDKVGIAELAQFTDVDVSGKYKVADAFNKLYAEWSFEVLDSDLEFLDLHGARILFKDGSSLTFKVKA